MDTQNLKAFITVAEIGSFSAAADQLHLTQPAVSKRINLLEQQLDTQLFDRIGRQVSLTEAGRTLLPLAQNIILAMRDARQQIMDLRSNVSGELRLVTSHHIGLHRLPAILRKFANNYPEVELDIQFEDSEQAYLCVLAGDYDLGIVTRSPVTDARISYQSVWLDRLVFVAAADHPLGQSESVTLEEICRHPALLPDHKFLTTRVVEELFHGRGLKLQTIMSTNYLETIRALISVGYGWGVLPEIMVSEDNVVRLPVKDVALHRNLDCIYHRDRSLSRPAKAFLELLRTASA